MTEQEEFEFRLRYENEGRAGKPAPEESILSQIKRGAGNIAAGAVRGAGSIGATLLASPNDLGDAVFGKSRPLAELRAPSSRPGGPMNADEQRRAGMTEGLRSMGAEPESMAFGAGKLGAEIAGTLGTGGAIARGAAAVPGIAAAAPNLIGAIGSSGMRAGTATGLPAALVRAGGGAIAGGASAGLVDPSQAGLGAAVGGALPAGMQALGAAGKAAGGLVRGAPVAPEVAALAGRAKDLGINIPADRLVNSKPLDAVASGLNYLPFSGRAATERKMAEQLNRAGSRLMGQDTTNINQALRAAGADLGAKFDATLKSTGVAFDPALLQDVSRVFNAAERELGSDALKAISSQVDDIVEKGATGTIDGQAAYNIKRTLDRIGNRNGPEAWHALELKGVLMDALNRSLGPQGAQAFAKTRQQYGNMLALEKLAKNGVEGEISVARLANLKNINNQPLQELADIAAQFVRPREAQHGAMQRAAVGLTAGATGGWPGLAAAAAGGRATNMLLNTDAARNAVLGQPMNLIGTQGLQQFGLRSAPVLAGDQ